MNATKPKERAKRDELDLLPADEANRRTDELLRRLLNTPHKPHTTKPKKRAKK